MESPIVSLFKKGRRDDPGNYRGKTLLNMVVELCDNGDHSGLRMMLLFC